MQIKRRENIKSRQANLQQNNQRIKSSIKSMIEIKKNDQYVNNIQFLIMKKAEIEGIHKHRKNFTNSKRLRDQEKINKDMYQEKSNYLTLQQEALEQKIKQIEERE